MPANFEIKRVELWSLFKISFFIYAVLGLIVGFVTFFFSLLMGGFSSALSGEEFPHFGLLSGAFGLFLIPFLAFFYGVVGSVCMTIGGWIFNIICGVGGGLRFEVSSKDTGSSGHAPPVPPGPSTPYPPQPSAPPYRPPTAGEGSGST
ncbi:MAG: hypothetical protein GTO51_10890 [Candidatus Latescibacteria bacterium]|nr:hypothetical protein [Candidatus Latescibacterota bacterium]NIM66470.1 hypothetical protein [Candidatus Latescibacterota bacterium]NIO02950.1 hypothetical protein [Candidatus Latescibacterota bacterium]NIO30085.1 hypothetical protein [Candidatus Latescibacterota bacterium]NIO57704.1 hypothetical protein [Candidatus Latescibacterota bacterium]